MSRGSTVLELAIRGSGRANILDADTMARLEVALWRAEGEGAAAVVLHGPPGRFAAGADLGDLEQLDGPAAHAFARAGSRLFRRFERTPLWLVAAVDGHCIGGGFDVALACDLIVATPEAHFRHPGGRFGFPTAYGGNRRLPSRLRSAPAHELLLRGRDLPAPEARRWGLIAELAPGDELLDRARRSAGRLADAGSRGMRAPLQGVLRRSGALSARAGIALERAAARSFYASSR